LHIYRGSLAAALMLLASAGGFCRAEEAGPVVASAGGSRSLILRRHQQVREQTSRSFRLAAFVSPAPDSKASIPLAMAPLIVQEFPEDLEELERSFVRFGAVEITPEGAAQVRQDRQTVYLLRSEVVAAGPWRDQFAFLWFYPPASSKSRLRYRGIRVTLDRRGFPAAWEILSSESECQAIYVSKPLEQAAAKQHESPLPGRRFALEPALEEQPAVVVPRAVDEGPIPMGPFVYLTARSLRITTLLCRCEPSQARDFPDSSHYRLCEIDGWRDLYPGESRPANLPSPPAAAALEKILRLPRDF
jgi:hypothetical protein